MSQIAVAHQGREILESWDYLPYKKFLSRSQDAVELFLAQFRISEEQSFECNGDLYLYSDESRLAGVRYLAGESGILKAQCGRLEPLVVTSGHLLREADTAKTVQFLQAVLRQTSELNHFSTPVAAADSNAQLALNTVGFRLADTILGYHLDLNLVKESEFQDKHVRSAREDDVEKISQIASQCFSDRTLNVNRFNSEPSFSPDSVGELYASWTSGAVLKGQADLTLVYDDGSSPSGFMTFKKPNSHESASGLNMGRAVLSAVDPNSQKRGIYRKLLHGGCLWLKQLGVESIEGKTQLSTVPVLRVWQSIGATLQIAYHTYHYQRK